MASEIDICNLALGQLGAHYITSFADGTTESVACATNYPMARDAVLESRDWTFAVVERQLTEITVPSGEMPPEFSHAYQVPTDCLLIRYCFLPSTVSFPDGMSGALITAEPTSEQSVQRPTWNRFEDRCYCNESLLWARYIKQVTDTTKYTNNFLQALATRLAFELAMPLTSKIETQSSEVEGVPGEG